MGKISTRDIFERELLKAIQKHGEGYSSYHEAYAILLEEFEEFWDEVKKRSPNDLKIREEAIHIAAVAFKIASMATKIADEKASR